MSFLDVKCAPSCGPLVLGTSQARFFCPAGRHYLLQTNRTTRRHHRHNYMCPSTGVPCGLRLYCAVQEPTSGLYFAELVGEIKPLCGFLECQVYVGLKYIYIWDDRQRTGVIEIGLKSLGCIGLLILGTGVIMVLFHWFVVLGGRTSQAVSVTCSVPHGSVLGPLLFILYTADLADLASKFGVNLRAFADDNRPATSAVCCPLRTHWNSASLP